MMVIGEGWLRRDMLAFDTGIHIGAAVAVLFRVIFRVGAV